MSSRDSVAAGNRPISGASMNPARTLGPDIVGSDYTGWWIYILGPVIGAAIAVAIIGGRPRRRYASSGWMRCRVSRCSSPA